MSSSPSTACCELLALREGVYSAVSHNGELHLVAWPHAQSFGQLTTGQRTVLHRLAEGPHGEADLHAIGREHDGDQGGSGVGRQLDRLRAGGWLAITVTQEGRPLYTLEPLRPPPPPPATVEPDLLLSRFAVLRRHGSGIVVESPRAWCDLRVHDPSVLVVIGGLTDRGPTLPFPSARPRRRRRHGGLAGGPSARPRRRRRHEGLAGGPSARPRRRRRRGGLAGGGSLSAEAS